jgi:hypothetical protein
MKKFFIVTLGFLFLLGVGCRTPRSTQSAEITKNQKNNVENDLPVTDSLDWKMYRSNYFKGLTFKMPADYAVEDGTATKIVTIKKQNGDVPRLEIFRMKDFGDRPWGFEGTETKDDLGQFIPKEQFIVQGFNVWFYYSEKDLAAKEGLHAIANSITYNLKNTTSPKSITLKGVIMTLPDKYSVLKVEGSKVWIKTDDTDYDVKLVLSVESIKASDFKDYVVDYDQYIYKKLSLVSPEKEIYNIVDTHYADGYEEFFVARINDKYFRVDYSIESNQEQPDNGDIWGGPDTKVTSQDVVSILKTIRR